MDPIDTMAELRVKQNKGAKWTGVDVRNTKVTDMFKQDVLEPLVVKEQIIKSATEGSLYVIEDRRCNRRKQIQNASWTTWRWWWRNGWLATVAEWIWSRLGVTSQQQYARN